MSTILNKANQIKNEKDTKVLPRNIKKGVTIFGVTGDFEGEGDISQYINTAPTDSDKTIIRSLPDLDTSGLYDAGDLFSNMTITELPNFTLENTYSISSMCAQMHNISEINLPNTSNVNSFNSCFANCSNLATIGDLYLDNANDLGYALNSTAIVTAPNMYNLGTSLRNGNWIEMPAIYQSCHNLKNIPEFIVTNYISQDNQGVITNMDNIIGYCANLTNQSLLNIIKLIPYTQLVPGSCNTTSLYDAGFTFKQVNRLDPQDITTYVTNNNWTTGYEDYLTFNISNNLVDANDSTNIITTNFSSLLQNGLGDNQTDNQIYVSDASGSHMCDASLVREPLGAPEYDLAALNTQIYKSFNGMYSIARIYSDDEDVQAVATTGGTVSYKTTSAFVYFEFTSDFMNLIDNYFLFSFWIDDGSGESPEYIWSDYNIEKDKIINNHFVLPLSIGNGYPYSDYPMFGGITIVVDGDTSYQIDIDTSELDNQDLYNNGPKLYDVTVDYTPAE